MIDDTAWVDELPPFIRAAFRGEAEEVQRLLKAGEDRDQADPGGMTALHAAVLADQASVVSELLKAGAAVDPRDEYGFTPLLLGTSASEQIVSDLLAAGADPMAHDFRMGWRPADRFAEANNAAALLLVLEAGAEADLENEDGWTPLADAAEAGALAALEVLLAAGADPRRQFGGKTAAELAKKQGHLRAARRLAAAAAESGHRLS